MRRVPGLLSKPSHLRLVSVGELSSLHSVWSTDARGLPPQPGIFLKKTHLCAHTNFRVQLGSSENLDAKLPTCFYFYGAVLGIKP